MRSKMWSRPQMAMSHKRMLTNPYVILWEDSKSVNAFFRKSQIFDSHTICMFFLNETFELVVLSFLRTRNKTFTFSSLTNMSTCHTSVKNEKPVHFEAR